MLSYQKALSLRQLGSLSKGVFERRTSTGSEVFFILKHLDAPKFVFLSVLTIIETSCPKRWAKPLSKNEKRPLPVDVRRSKTSLLKFTIEMGITRELSDLFNRRTKRRYPIPSVELSIHLLDSPGLKFGSFTTWFRYMAKFPDDKGFHFFFRPSQMFVDT